MSTYTKPVVLVNEELAEGVYAASGTVVKDCDSIYMQGVWQGQDTSSWWQDGVEYPRGYKQQFGCLGCPAHTDHGCGLADHYEDSDKAASYGTDAGLRMPTWEKKGYGPNDVVSDWSC